MSWLEASRARLRLLFRRRAAESRADEEFHFHLDMHTDHLVREAGLSRDEARRRAMAAFGGVQNHRESMRDGRGLAWVSGLSLDFKLGARMLVKYPGLTIIGGMAMAFGIWFGAVTFQMFGMLTGTKLPLPDGDRVVKVQAWDAKTLQEEDRVLFDYQVWRTSRSLADMGAYRDASVNLVGADGGAQPEAAAEVTASAFRIAPERPVLGRVIDASDERPGAPPVVVLGHDVWTNRFNGDPQVVGRQVKIGTAFATVIGVMPPGFAFPVAHELWLPFRADVDGAAPRSGAALTVFGRLADGVTLENAQSEFAVLGKQIAAEQPATHEQLQPHVIPYAQASVDTNDMSQVKALSYFFVVVLVLVVCSTVALLLFARAAARETEILVRSALGASHRRIVAQLFAEALVLAGVAAVVGLASAQLALTRWGEPYLLMGYETERLPFWYDFNLSPATIAYALALAVVGAVVAGVMPARKITRGLGTRLRAGTAGGGVVSFGGVWTVVIVVQVALTVALPSVVMLVRGEARRVAAYDYGFPVEQYLAVTLGVDGAPDSSMAPDVRAALIAREASTIEALRERLSAEPGVAGATLVDKVPGEPHAVRYLEPESLAGRAPTWVATATIHPSYFDVMQAPVRTGRTFTSADRSPDARVVIVDQAFVDSVMSGRNPVGHRVRLRTSAQLDADSTQLPWYEIVGVTKDLGMSSTAMPQRWPGVYLPLGPGSRGAARMIVHVRGDVQSIASRVRELAVAVDASLRVERVMRFDQAEESQLWLLGAWTQIILGLAGVALVLSLAGIYSVLAYIVARRTREIGVRVALGAGARRVIRATFSRPLTQVTLGVIAGAVLIALASMGVANTTQFRGTGIGGLSLGDIPLLVGYAILMLGVCALACLVPTIRALRVQPTEALRVE